jgi:hypothetical protein
MFLKNISNAHKCMFMQSNYYPGDYYDYYAVTKSPWDSGLESMR